MNISTIIPILGLIIISTIVGNKIMPSTIEENKIIKVENRVINNEKALFEAIQRYVLLENDTPTMETLVQKGYFEDINNKGFNDNKFEFIVNKEQGLVKIQTKIEDVNARTTFLNSHKNSFKPTLLDEETGLVETTFILQTEISHDFGQFISGIPIQSETPHPSETKYWYDTNGTEIVLRVYDELKGGWVASNSSANELITKENVAYSKEELNTITDAKEGDVKYAYDSTTNSVQEYVYMENVGWTTKGMNSKGVRHYTDNPYMDQQAIKFGYATKDNKDLILCYGNLYWCLKDNPLQIIDKNINNGTQATIVHIGENFTTLNMNCDDITLDYGTTKYTQCKVTTNAYIDNEAINFGRAKQNNVVLEICNNNKHWCEIGTTQIVDKDLIERDAIGVKVIGTPTYAGYSYINITNQPYNSINTLANAVGLASWNGTLFHKLGNLWHYSSNNTYYNPCHSEWSANFSNLTCSRSITTSYNYVLVWEDGSGSCNFYGSYKYAPFGDDVIHCIGTCPYGGYQSWETCYVGGSESRHFSQF